MIKKYTVLALPAVVQKVYGAGTASSGQKVYGAGTASSGAKSVRC